MTAMIPEFMRVRIADLLRNPDLTFAVIAERTGVTRATVAKVNRLERIRGRRVKELAAHAR